MALASGSFGMTIGGSITGNQTSDTTLAYLESVDLDMGDPMTLKHIQRIHLWMLGPRPNVETNMRIILKARNNLDQPHVVLATIPLYDLVRRWRKFKNADLPPNQDVGSDYTSVDDFRDYPIKLHLKGYRFFRIRLEDAGVTEFWRFFGLSIYGKSTGARF